jgi:hypothetical protein
VRDLKFNEFISPDIVEIIPFVQASVRPKGEIMQEKTVVLRGHYRKEY